LESFGLSREDTEDKDQWRLGIRGEMANLAGFTWKVAIKKCLCLSVSVWLSAVLTVLYCVVLAVST